MVNNLEETTGWVKITHGRELLRFVIQDPDGKAFLTGKCFYSSHFCTSFLSSKLVKIIFTLHNTVRSREKTCSIAWANMLLSSTKISTVRPL